MLSEIKNFYYLTDLIAASGQPSEAQLEEIHKAGYEVVINLALHDNPEYSLPDEKGTVEKLGMHYIHIPVLFDHPTTENLDLFFQAMRENESRKVFVHCAMNYRVSAFMGLYFRIVKNMPHGESFVLMCKIWEPDEVWAAFIADALKGHGIED
jgi:protein tyrosine phosphatase (PTP) superfamily phosphohydrolase (DUF442 family)